LNIVIDTNVALDLFVFRDPATAAMGQALQGRALIWLATPIMREELRRVLAYPHLLAKMQQRGTSADMVLSEFDALAQVQAIAPKAIFTCTDADDQKFVDLAVAHTALLLSKDKAVLALRKRLARLGVSVQSRWTMPA
jgi:putative PIN family toxin of toxin-antitoxin system